MERENAEEDKKLFLAFEQGLPHFHTVLSPAYSVAIPALLNKYLWILAEGRVFCKLSHYMFIS